ncbi:MAG: 1,4-dihydroxy-2-naphthoate polyprenyltransferase [Deltaproteobacteria bacterium]|nr:MAG: 1,4-dihydroxy-2-naphthoate polyprenyltransferase [Deltaproteobacteria bacterium]
MTAHAHAAARSPAGRARAWWLAARPKTLWVGVVPVAVGSAVAAAAGGFALGPALAALAGAVAIQIGTNFANDAFDCLHGADGPDRLGPTRAAAAGLLSPRTLLAGTAVAFAVALAAGAYLATIGGWPIVAIGLASLASGLAYTGGPYPLGYHGLGDVFVFAFFGVVAVCGTVYVQLGTVPALAWLASVPIGALATCVLAVNNARDADTDARAGKRTIAVRFGRRAALVEYAALVAIAYAAPVAIVAAGLAGPWALLPLASAPLAAQTARGLWRSRPEQMNPFLGATARLLIVYGALLAVGVLL